VLFARGRDNECGILGLGQYQESRIRSRLRGWCPTYQIERGDFLALFRSAIGLLLRLIPAD